MTIELDGCPACDSAVPVEVERVTGGYLISDGAEVRCGLCGLPGVIGIDGEGEIADVADIGIIFAESGPEYAAAVARLEKLDKAGAL